LVSAARTLVLADYLPVTQLGVTISAPAMWWPAKQSADVADFSLDATVAIDPADSIIQASAQVSPSAGLTDLAAIDLSVSQSVLTVWLSAGVAALSYSVLLKALTQMGRTFSWYLLLQVLGETFETGAPISLKLPSTLAFGLCSDTSAQILTDTNGASLSSVPRMWTRNMISDSQGRTLTDTRGLPILAALNAA
jgi:hypothetical protein